MLLGMIDGVNRGRAGMARSRSGEIGSEAAGRVRLWVDVVEWSTKSKLSLCFLFKFYIVGCLTCWPNNSQ